MSSSQLIHIFRRGRYTNHQPVYVYIFIIYIKSIYGGFLSHGGSPWHHRFQSQQDCQDGVLMGLDSLDLVPRFYVEPKNRWQCWGKTMEKPWENTWKTWGVQSSDLFFSLNVRKQIGQTPGIHGFSDPNSWQFWMFIPKRKVQKLLIHPQVKHEGVANIGMGLWWGYDLPNPLITGDFPKKIWSFDHRGWVKLPLFQLPYDWGYWGNQHPAIPAILGT